MDPDPKGDDGHDEPLSFGASIAEDAQPQELAPDPSPTNRTALGELVEHRSWFLIVPVFLFALFLAAMPFFFAVERSPYVEALELYERLCINTDAPSKWADDLSAAGRAALAERPDDVTGALICLDRQSYKTKFEPVSGRLYGPDRAYVLTFMDPSTKDPRDVESDDVVPLRLMFVVESDRVRWDPFGLPAANRR